MSQYPSNSARIEAAMRFAAEGRREQARTLLMEVVRSDPNNATAWTNLAQLVEDRERAIYCWQQVLRIDPGNLQATRQIAQLQRGAFTQPSGRAAARTADQRRRAARRPMSGLAFIGAILAGLSVALLAVMLGGAGGSGGFLFPAPTATPGRPVAEVNPTEAPARATLPPPRTPADSPTPTVVPTASDTPTPRPSVTPLPTWTPEDTATPRPPYVAPPPPPPFMEPLPTSTPWPPVQSLNVRIQTRYYYFGGATIFDVQNALWLRSEAIGEGDYHAIATTETEFRVQSQLVQSGQTCVVPNFTVYLDLIYTYPQWQPSGAPDPVVVAEWRRFIEHVIDHEETHGQISYDCAVELVQTIRAFNPGTTCEQSSAGYDQMVSEITAACEARQLAFDRSAGFVTFPLGTSGTRAPSPTPTQTGTGTPTPGGTGTTGTPRP